MFWKKTFPKHLVLSFTPYIYENCTWWDPPNSIISATRIFKILQSEQIQGTFGGEELGEENEKTIKASPTMRHWVSKPN